MWHGLVTVATIRMDKRFTSGNFVTCSRRVSLTISSGSSPSFLFACDVIGFESKNARLRWRWLMNQKKIGKTICFHVERESFSREVIREQFCAGYSNTTQPDEELWSVCRDEHDEYEPAQQGGSTYLNRENAE